mmetsp:Transcript_44314/g.141897  ORF Transcript_44314/g.141897 Transcript_44314/m.141897 type:complete len:314 (+) Transcript_44314:531-1472(+)
MVPPTVCEVRRCCSRLRAARRPPAASATPRTVCNHRAWHQPRTRADVRVADPARRPTRYPNQKPAPSCLPAMGHPEVHFYHPGTQHQNFCCRWPLEWATATHALCPRYGRFSARRGQRIYAELAAPKASSRPPREMQKRLLQPERALAPQSRRASGAATVVSAAATAGAAPPTRAAQLAAAPAAAVAASIAAAIGTAATAAGSAAASLAAASQGANALPPPGSAAASAGTAPTHGSTWPSSMRSAKCQHPRLPPSGTDPQLGGACQPPKPCTSVLQREDSKLIGHLRSNGSTPCRCSGHYKDPPTGPAAHEPL